MNDVMHWVYPSENVNTFGKVYTPCRKMVNYHTQTSATPSCPECIMQRAKYYEAQGSDEYKEYIAGDRPDPRD